MKHFNSLKLALLCFVCLLGISTRSYALSGTYVVGAGGDYPTLTTAITDLNINGVTGPVVFNIVPGTYSGTDWQVQFNSFPGMSAANTVTLQPQGGVKGSVVISAAGTGTANYVLSFLNSSYIRVYNLTFSNTNSTNATVVRFAGTSSFDSLANCTFTSAGPSPVVSIGPGNTFTGSNLSLTKDTIENGSSSIYIDGAAAAVATNMLFQNNHCTNAASYGLYTNYTTNLIARNNRFLSSSASFNTIIYTGYNAGGLDISGNTAVITTTTGAKYCMYNNYINNPTNTVAANITSNNLVINATTGTVYPLYNNYCQNLKVIGNTLNANATTGSIYPPVAAYGGNTVTVANNTFGMTTTTGGITPGNYNLIWNSSTTTPMDVTVRENTFNYNTTSGQLGNTSSNQSTNSYCYYPIGCKVNKNNYNITATTAMNMYGLSGYYFIMGGSGVTINFSMDSNTFVYTAPTANNLNGLSYYYGFYYGNDNSFSANNFTYNVNTGQINGAWCYAYFTYYGDRFKCNDNVVNCTGTSVSIWSPSQNYWMMYCNFSECNRNKFTNTTTSGQVYCPQYGPYYTVSSEYKDNSFVTNTVNGSIYSPNYMCYNPDKTKMLNNTFTVNATGSAYVTQCYYGMMYAANSLMRGNTFNVNATGTTTSINSQYLNAYGSSDTLEYNTFNWNTSGGSIYMYNYYAANLTRNNTFNFSNTTGSNFFYLQFPQGGIYTDNTINSTTTTGTIYSLYNYYPNSLVFKNNTLNSNTTSGTIYGVYDLGNTSYTGDFISYNKFNLNSSANGSVFGFYGQTPNGTAYYSNVFNINTTGPAYSLYNPSGMAGDTKFYNNTFNSNSTNTGTNTMIYAASGGSGKLVLWNNIFSRTNGAASANPIYVGDTTRVAFDHNLYYSPNAITFQSVNPSLTTTNFSTWRKTTKQDLNSLIYDPGFVNATSNDLHISTSNPNAWAANGRGKLIVADTMDIDGNVRPRTRQQGVIDLGAYQFTPNSIPPACVADPATPVSGARQYFTFGGDTAASILWGPSVPSTSIMRQYPGDQAGAPMPGPVGRSFLWLNLNTGGSVTYAHTPTIYYKNDQLGTISSETNTKFANSPLTTSPWIGYNFGNSTIDSVLNLSAPSNPLDSTGSYTMVENARIGIRCVVLPTGLAAENITADAADLKWDPVFLPIGYQVIVDKIPGSPAAGAGPISFTTTNSLSLPSGSLTEATEYYMHVRTICGVKDTSGWSTIKFRTLVTCHAPDAKIISLTNSRAIIVWDTVETATHYEFAMPDKELPVPVLGGALYTNSYIAQLIPNKEYFFYVRSFCKGIYPQSDWTLVKWRTFPTSINTVGEGKGIGLSAYPNPVTNLLHVELSNTIDGDATLTVVDMTGKLVQTINVKSNNIDVNMSGLPAGVYQLKYSDRSHVDVMKVTKQ